MVQPLSSSTLPKGNVMLKKQIAKVAIIHKRMGKTMGKEKRKTKDISLSKVETFIKK